MKPEKFTAIFFLSVIMIFMCLVPFSVVRKAAIKLANPDNVINIDWEKIYPFEADIFDVPVNEATIIDYLMEKINNYTSSKLAGSQFIIEAAKMYEELIGWNMALVNDYNPVIKLNDGYLWGLVESRDVSSNARAVKEFSDYCHSLGIEYVYINYPAKICSSLDQELSGILDFTNQNADNLMRMLKDSGVRAYDFRKTLHDDGMNHHEAFFRTDHHWKPETGLWAARHILQILRNDYGWDVEPDILKPENFEYVIYPEWFLGSQGKKLTLSRTTPDDISAIYPKFHTSLRFEVPTLGIDASGDFTVTYNMAHVDHKEYYKDEINPYGMYKYGDLPLTRTSNMLCSNNRKLLILRDSMSNCVTPFVSLGVQQTDEIDLRHFTGSLRSYIAASKPDMVITAYYSAVPGRTVFPSTKLYYFQ